MIDELLDYYKENLTTYSLVFKFFKWKYWFFFAMLGSIFLMIMLLGFLVSMKVNVFVLSIVFLICLFVVSVMFFVINSNAKSILKSKYNIISDNWLWRNKAFEKMRADKLKEYLIKAELYEEKKINLLIDLLNKEVERRKIPSFVTPGILLALLVPVWIQYINIVYKNILDRTEALAFFIGISFSVFFMVYIGGMSKSIYTTIKESIANDESIRIKRLIPLLEDCLLRYSNIKS